MKKGLFVAIAFGMMLLHSSTGWAAEMDVLLNKLVEKEILTPLEAQIIKDETKADVAKQIAAQEQDTLPKWIQSMKLKGDMRLRYQYEKKEAATHSRNRGRLRFRLGVESKINDQVKVKAGLASGSDDPRSTNQTFQNYFETPDIRLDYVYATYQPYAWMRLAGGKYKMKNWLWTPTDLLWDSDVSPDGAAVHLEHALIENTDGFFNAAINVLDENGASSQPDPTLAWFQAGVKYQDEKVDAKVAGTYYNTNGIKGQDPDFSSDTNTREAGNVLKYDYDTCGASVELGVKELFGGLPFAMDERVAVFADYIKNPDPDDQNQGWAAGVKFGNKKAKKKGQWQMKYIYARLERDAWVDFLPDSDRYGGKTNAKGHEVALNYALFKNVIFGLDYYHTDTIKGTSNKEDLVQVDLNFKF